MRKFLIAAVLVLPHAAPRAARAGLLTAQGVAIVDQSGAQRAVFSSNERIGLSQRVHNGVASSGRTAFRFEVYAPTGNKVFEHSGNSVPGTVGNAAGQITGVPISGFYVGPGLYSLKAIAVLDGVTLEQVASFTVSSPNILLIYPPNGARDLSDKPLTFRWSSSGAQRYRVIVGDNPSFYNSIFSELTAGNEAYYSYPENPSDSRQRLAAGQVYYWKIEGLDAAGNKVAESEVPFSFTAKTAALTRDLAVTSLEADQEAPDGDVLYFKIGTANQGGTNESNAQLKFSLGGLPAPGTPVALIMSPGETRDFRFSAQLPAGQGENIAVACIEFFDDNVANNCKTLRVTRAALSDSTTGQIFSGPTTLTPEQLWEAIRQLLKERGYGNLDDYTLVGIDGEMSADELASLLDQLRRGEVDVTLTGPAPGYKAPKLPPPVVKAPPAAPVAAASSAEDAPAEEELGVLQEWVGQASPISKQASTIHVTDRTAWRRLWRQLGQDKTAPKVDFKKVMIVGVISGASEQAERVNIETIQNTLLGLEVRYVTIVHRRMLNALRARKAKPRSLVPYHLMAIPKSTLNVEFKESERRGG